MSKFAQRVRRFQDQFLAALDEFAGGPEADFEWIEQEGIENTDENKGAFCALACAHAGLVMVGPVLKTVLKRIGTEMDPEAVRRAQETASLLNFLKGL